MARHCPKYPVNARLEPKTFEHLEELKDRFDLDRGQTIGKCIDDLYSFIEQMDAKFAKEKQQQEGGGTIEKEPTKT